MLSTDHLLKYYIVYNTLQIPAAGVLSMLENYSSVVSFSLKQKKLSNILRISYHSRAVVH